MIVVGYVDEGSSVIKIYCRTTALELMTWYSAKKNLLCKGKEAYLIYKTTAGRELIQTVTFVVRPRRQRSGFATRPSRLVRSILRRSRLRRIFSR